MLAEYNNSYIGWVVVFFMAGDVENCGLVKGERYSVNGVGSVFYGTRLTSDVFSGISPSKWLIDRREKDEKEYLFIYEVVRDALDERDAMINMVGILESDLVVEGRGISSKNECGVECIGSGRHEFPELAKVLWAAA